MWRSLTLAVTILACCTGCKHRHFRYVDPAGEKWQEELAEYPRIEKRNEGALLPVIGQELEVYYLPEDAKGAWKFAARGGEGSPEERPVILADLTVFRGPLPEHEEALSELAKMAQGLGAHMLVETHCTAVMGEKRLGGTELVGWIYRARAARRREECP